MTRGWRGRALGGLLLAAALALPAAGRAETVPWRLGRDTVLVAPSASFAYRLPAGTAQGPRTWYLLHLHFQLELDPRSGPGLAYVSGLTNGRAAVQIKFETARRRGSLVTTWSSVDLLEGRRERRTRAAVIDVVDGNYLQVAGVLPGRNVLTVKVEQFGGARVRTVRVLRDTRIEATSLAPARLRLEVETRSRPSRVGESFRLPFQLENVGGRPAKRVSVRAAYDRRFLALVGSDVLRYPVVAGRIHGAFVFRARREGRSQVALAVASSSNRPSAVVEVNVGTGATEPSGRVVRSAVFGLLLLAVVLALVACRRRC